MQSNWTSLNKIIGPIQCFVSEISKDNYIVVTRDGIWRYNFEEDQWSKLLGTQNNFNFKGCSAALNDKSKKLFILSKDGKLAQLQLNNKSFIIISDKVTNVGYGAKCVIIDNTLHVIGGKRNSSHLKWNEEDKQFRNVVQLHNNECLGAFGLIYNRRTNCILAIGGYDYGLRTPVDHILELNIDKKKWTKLQISLPKCLCYFGCTFAFRRKYVIIFGGNEWNDYGGGGLKKYTDAIYIYDIKNKTIKKSKQKCPKRSLYSAMTINEELRDEMAVCGYVRCQWNISNIDHHYFPPVYILNIIKRYFYKEYICLLDLVEGYHYKINSLDIL